MKKLINFRLDTTLIEALTKEAATSNRTLTNLFETICIEYCKTKDLQPIIERKTIDLQDKPKVKKIKELKSVIKSIQQPVTPASNIKTDDNGRKYLLIGGAKRYV